MLFCKVSAASLSYIYFTTFSALLFTKVRQVDSKNPEIWLDKWERKVYVEDSRYYFDESNEWS